MACLLLIHRSCSTLGRVFNHGLPVSQKIRLDRTTPNYGGVRWWFICPKCDRRVTRLHRPSHTYYFFCRHCYDLTYESAQSSRTRSDTFFSIAANEIGATKRVARLSVRLRYTEGRGVQEVKRPVINRARDRRNGIANVEKLSCRNAPTPAASGGTSRSAGGLPSVRGAPLGLRT